jgi:hypothetical protein
MPPGFYNPYDQQVYDAGFKYIPQSKYLLNPFKIPTDDSTTPPDTGGITSLNRGGGDGFNPYNTDMSKVRQDYNAFPSRQAGEIYSGTFNPRSLPGPQMPDKLGISTNTVPLGNNRISASQLGINLPGGQVQNAYNRARNAMNMRGDDTMSRDYPEFTAAEVARLTNDSIQDYRQNYGAQGQYVDQYDPNYSSMTEAQKFMDNYPDYYGVPSGVPEPGIPAAIGRYMSNSLLGKGFGIAKDFLGRVMPINERAIMENEARGAGIFTDDIGRIVTDDYNTAGGIMAGYNLNKIDAGTFDKRRGTIENTLGSKYGLTAGQIEAAKNNPNYKGPGANLIERLGLLDESEKDIFDARKKTKQIYKMRKDKKDADKKRKEAEAAAAAAAAQAERNRVAQVQNRLDTGSYVDRDSGGYSASDRAVGGGREATNAQGQNAAQATAAGTGTSQGYSQHYMDGGRVYYMDGGLADMLEIYD